MPRQRLPLFALKASGKIGGHRRGRRRTALRGATSVLPFTKDTYLNGMDPDVNYGAANFVSIGMLYVGELKTYWNRPLVNVDLTSLGTVAVLSAHLVLHVTSSTNSDHDCVAARCTRPATWTEDGATWNDYDFPEPWTAPGGDYSATEPPELTFLGPPDIGLRVFAGFGPLVQDAISNRAGLFSAVVRLADEAPDETRRWSWYSRTGAGTAPTLVVEYES